MRSVLRIVDGDDIRILIRYSEDQERDDHGRFGSGGGSDSGGTSASTAGAGRDLSHDGAALQRVYEDNVDANGQWRDSGSGDAALTQLATEQGFDAAPQVVGSAEFDRMVQDGGHTVLYRGMQGTDAISAADMHAGIREGEYRPGYGIFGNGYYMAPGLEKAETFSDHTPGSVGRYAIHADSRTIDYEDLRSEFGAQFDDPGWKSLPVADRAILSDYGRFAMARGYDAVRVPAGTRMIGGSPVQREEWVILNRGALIADDGS